MVTKQHALACISLIYNVILLDVFSNHFLYYRKYCVDFSYVYKFLSIDCFSKDERNNSLNRQQQRQTHNTDFHQGQDY